MKIILLVIDGFGIGELPDADIYGDCGANTYKALNKKTNIPHLVGLGMNNIFGVDKVPHKSPIGCFGRVRELSHGKDTLTGHHEIAGIITYNPPPVYPNGFPLEIISQLEESFGRKIIGNVATSGTEIINQLGDEHLKSGELIVYTSADSVLQIAAHESIVPIDELYRISKIAREIMTGEHAIGRIIARPFLGSDGDYHRTENRKDFGLKPRSITMLDSLQSVGIKTIAIGKIMDIFTAQGISEHIEAHGNFEVGQATIRAAATNDNALIFANMGDTDMLYGHRRDVYGYQLCMEELDGVIGGLKETMLEDDILIITSDHGCDPSFESSTDHTREYTPLVIYGRSLNQGVDLGSIIGMDSIAHTILDLFGIVTTHKSLKAKILPTIQRSMMQKIGLPIRKALKLVDKGIKSSK